MRACFGMVEVAVCVVAFLSAGCQSERATIAGMTGAPGRGKATIEAYGCGKCHTIPGIHDAKGVVGPPLVSVAQRTYIAGNFPNTPETLASWVMAPQSMKPKTAMPSLGLSALQAQDVVAYLEKLQ